MGHMKDQSGGNRELNRSALRLSSEKPKLSISGTKFTTLRWFNNKFKSEKPQKCETEGES